MIGKLRRSVPLVFSAFFCYFLFKMPDFCAESVKKGIALCGNVVLPSLFLFFCFSNFLLQSGLAARPARFFAPLTKALFRLPGVCACAIFMGAVGGYPLGLLETDALYRQGEITQEEAKRLSLFAFNAGPAFVIFTVGVGILHSEKAGVLLYISMLLSGLLLGICTRFFAKETLQAKESVAKTKCPYPSFFEALCTAVSNAAHAMLSICAWVVLFYSVTACLSTLPMHEETLLFLNCLLEVTVGVRAAASTFPLPVLASILSFGGFCVHCQVYVFLQNIGIELKYFLASRVLSAVLSCAICALLLKIFPCEISVFGPVGENISVAAPASVPAFLSLLLMSILFILELDRTPQIC